jgi:hypothetical protein
MAWMTIGDGNALFRQRLLQASAAMMADGDGGEYDYDDDDAMMAMMVPGPGNALSRRAR